ncbi:MAG: phosphoadenosine phosphosulfate reductase, partial [Pseudomonadota bacterium]
MGILAPLLAQAMAGTLDQRVFSAIYRQRRENRGYLLRLLAHLEDQGRPYLTGLLARAADERLPDPRFREAWTLSEMRLSGLGRRLPLSDLAAE